MICCVNSTINKGRAESTAVGFSRMIVEGNVDRKTYEVKLFACHSGNSAGIYWRLTPQSRSQEKPDSWSRDELHPYLSSSRTKVHKAPCDGRHRHTIRTEARGAGAGCRDIPPSHGVVDHRFARGAQATQSATGMERWLLSVSLSRT